MEFTTVQIIASMSYPLSFVSLLLGTISWHFHNKEVVLDTLKLSEKLKVVPFFLVIIVQKAGIFFVHLTDNVNKGFGRDFKLYHFSEPVRQFFPQVSLVLWSK